MQREERVLQKLILYVVDQLQEQGVKPSLIKLTKLLYLIDVEHYRQYGRTLTPLDWVYHKFGPWAFSLPRVLKTADIDLGEEEFLTKDGREGRAFFVVATQDITGIVPLGAARLVDRIVRVWALEATNFLLGYVYFHTEPMLETRRGERLRFDTVVRELPDERVTTRVAEDSARRLRGRLLEALSRRAADMVPVLDRRDEAYIEAMRRMERDGTLRWPVGDAPEADAEVLDLVPDAHD